MHHNLSYLPFGLEDWPTALFSNAGARTRDSLVHAAVINKKRFNAQLDESNFANLCWRPHVVADLIANQKLTPSEQNKLLGSSLPLLFRVMLQNYPLFSEQFEDRLYADLESVERLVTYLQVERKKGRKPMSFYSGLLDADPNRALRIIEDETERAFKRDMLADSAMSMRCTSAAWAFFYLRAHPGESIPAEILPVLAQSEEYSYLAAKLMSSRAVVSAEYAGLLKNLKSPRWIYHALRDGLGVDTEAMIAILLNHPAWLIQYLTKAQMGIEQKEEIYALAVEAISKDGDNHPCEQDLHLWFQSQSTHEVLAALTAAAAA